MNAFHYVQIVIYIIMIVMLGMAIRENHGLSEYANALEDRLDELEDDREE